MAQALLDPDVRFLRQIGYVMVVVATLAGAVTLSIALTESNAIAIAGIATVPEQVALRQELFGIVPQ